MNIALVHDWLVGTRGGERCLEVFAKLYPGAPVYTLLHVPGSVSSEIEDHRIYTSFIQNIPKAKKNYRYLLPLFPAAVKGLDVSEFDVILSSSHCAAKGVKKGDQSLHICYCYTPMRYVWDMWEEYFGEERIGKLRLLALQPLLSRLRSWDRKTAHGVDVFVAISKFVQDRIKRFYNRDSHVIYPPVNGAYYHISEKVDDYYLAVSSLVPYKRMDIALEAFKGLGLKLIVVGTGPEEEKLKGMASKNITFLGHLPDDEIKELYSKARALIFPGVEDFGIVPLEAQASGRPVIAFRGGGALESVLEGETGVFFYPQEPEALQEAVRTLDPARFDSKVIRDWALRFDRSIFKERINQFVNKCWERWRDEKKR